MILKVKEPLLVQIRHLVVGLVAACTPNSLLFKRDTVKTCLELCESFYHSALHVFFGAQVPSPSDFSRDLGLSDASRSPEAAGVNSWFGHQDCVRFQSWQDLNGHKFGGLFSRSPESPEMPVLHVSVGHSVPFKQCMFQQSVLFSLVSLTLAMFSPWNGFIQRRFISSSADGVVLCRAAC